MTSPRRVPPTPLALAQTPCRLPKHLTPRCLPVLASRPTLDHSRRRVHSSSLSACRLLPWPPSHSRAARLQLAPKHQARPQVPHNTTTGGTLLPQKRCSI